MFNFPSSPAVGATFTAPNGAQYTWNGFVWMQNITVQTPVRASNRNILVNGAMQTSSQNGTNSGTTDNYYFADQWFLGRVVSAMTGQLANNLSSLARYAASMINTGTGTPAVGSYGGIFQPIEGIRLWPLRWGTAAAIPAVLNFKVLTNFTGSIGASIRDGGFGQSIVWNVPVTSGVLTEVTLKIPAITTGTWSLTGAGLGAYLEFMHHCGTTFKTPFEGIWTPGNFMAPNSLPNNYATASQQIQIFDVQLLPDPDNTGAAPAFVPRMFTDDIIEAQRYWRTLDIPMMYMAGATLTGAYQQVDWQPLMRITPVTPVNLLLTNRAYSTGGTGVNPDSAIFAAHSNGSGNVQVIRAAGMSGIVPLAGGITLNSRLT